MIEFCLQDRSETAIDESLARMSRLVGKRTGLVRQVAEVALTEDNLGVFQYSALGGDISRFLPRMQASNGQGKAFTKKRAIASAIGEVLERYCCAIYHPSEWTFAAYGEVAAHALALEDLALFSDEQYAQECRELTRISADTRLNWVAGYSLTEQRPVLVPACFVFLPYTFDAVETPIIWEGISTGAATGASLEEAILSGIYEVVERDATMISWFNELPLPRLDLSTCPHALVQNFVERATRLGLELIVSDATLDTGIPTFVCSCLDKKGQEPYAMVASATGLNPERTLIKALEELAQGRAVMAWRETNKMHVDFNFDGDYRQIKKLTDHFLLYAKLDLRTAFDFLAGRNGATRRLDQIPNRASPNVRENIALCVELLKKRGLAVIVVDITPPEIREIGLYAAKVIIPGAQPLNGPYIHRYLGSKRLYRVPRVLGYVDRDTRPEALNKLPHPFP